MAPLVTETFPTTLPAIEQKSDSQSVPVGQENLWVDAGDMNSLGQMVVSVGRALRLNALMTGTTVGGINGKAFRYTSIDTTKGIGVATVDFATSLKKAFAAAIEKIEEDGDLDGTASAGSLFGVKCGLVSGPSGTFVTGRLYGLSSDGGLITHTSGANIPVALGLNATTAYVDMGGRFTADNTSIQVDANGNLRVKAGAQLTLGDTQINGTFGVTGLATFTDDLKITSGMARMILFEDDASSNEGFYDVIINAGSMIWRTRTDAGGSGETFMQVSRSGTTVSLISFANGDFRITNKLTVSGDIISDSNNGADFGDGTAANQDISTVDEGSADADKPRFYWDDGIQSFIMTKPLISQSPQSRSYTHSTGPVGTHHIVGWYQWPTTDANLDQGTLTQTHGTAASANGGHAGIVAAAAGTVDTGVVGLRVTGTTISEAGVRATGQSVTLVADITALATDQYVETTEKWLGQITFELFAVSGSPVNFSLDFNYGRSKYEDFMNRDFTLKSIEAGMGEAGATDASFDLKVIHHKATGWTYAATGFAPGPQPINSVITDYSTDNSLINGQPFAWKRTGLAIDVNGNDGEGLITQMITGTNNSVDELDLHLDVIILQ